MRTIYFLLACLFAINVSSQITINDFDLVEQGDVLYKAYDENPISSINIGSSGINQNWDFSTLQITEIDTLNFISPVGTAYANLYTNVNLCMEDKGSLSYFNKNSSSLDLYGRNDTVFNNPAVFFPLPLDYGLSMTDGPNVVIEQNITGPSLSFVLPASTVSTLTNGLANQADTALIQITNTTDFTVDASGVITTPLGTFDVLRLKQVQSTSSILNIYVSDSLTQIGTWLTNISFSSIPLLSNFSNDQEEILYQWLTNDPSVEFLIAETVVDSLDNIVEGISFQISPTTSIEEYFSSRELIRVTDLLGREIRNPDNNQALFYIYNDGTVEKKIVVK